MPRRSKSKRRLARARLTRLLAAAALAGVSIVVLTRAASALSSTWTQNQGSYDWGTSANWTNGIPQNAGDSATFAISLPSPGALLVDLNGDRTLSQLALGNSQGAGGIEITQGSGGALIFSGVGGPATAQFTSAGGFGFSHTISAPMVLATDTNFFSSIQQAQVTLAGRISGAGALAYDNDVGGVQPGANGVGQFRVSGANSYTGGTTIRDASVLADSNSAFGTGSVTVLAGGQAYTNSTLTLPNNFTLNGTGWNDGFGLKGALRLEGSSTLNGSVTLATNATLYNDFGAAVINGAVSGPGVLTKAGNGSYVLNGVNTLPSMTITAGTIQIGAGGTSGTFGFGPVSTSLSGTLAIDHSDPVTFTNALSGSGSFRKMGSNVVTLPGALAYTGNTYISQGELLVTGTLNGTAGTQLIFDGTGTFTAAEAANRNQGMTSLSFQAGDGAVQSVYPGSGTTRLTFATALAQSLGATGNFIVAGGTNGTTNGILLGGLPKNAIIAPAFFFGGSSFAWIDSAGLVRGINYASDAGAVRVTASTASTAGTHIQVSGSGVITAQTTAAFSTLNLANANDFTLASGATLTVGGILRSGNVSGGTISGGTLQPTSTSELVVRTDAAADTLIISSPIVANASRGFIKSGLGTLTLTGATSYTGSTAINAGVLNLNPPGDTSPFNSGSTVTVQHGATLAIDAGAHHISIPSVFVAGDGVINLATTDANGLTLGSNWTNFSGTLNINSIGAGRVTLAATVLPAAMTVNVASGASLYENGGSFNNTTRIIGDGNGDHLGALRLSAIQSGPVVLLGDSSIGVGPSDAGVIMGSVSESGGSFSLSKVGAGILEFRGLGLTHTGLTTVREGALEFRADGAAPGGLQIGGPTALGNTMAEILVATLTVPGGKTLAVGANAASPYTSTLNVTGTLNNAGSLNVGANSTASVTGGLVNQTGPLTLRGLGAAPTSLNLASGTFIYNAATPIVLDAAAGTAPGAGPVVNLGNVSTFTTNQPFALTAGSGGTSPVINLLNGSTLRLSADIPALITGPGVVNLADSAGIIDTQAFSTTLGSVLQDQTVFAGSLTKKGTGTLTLTALNTYTGDTTVSAGTLIITGRISGTTKVNGATAVLAGTGTVGDVTLTAGTLTSGNASIAPLSTKNLTLDGGALLFELAPNATSDRLAVAGSVSLSAPIELKLSYSANLPDHTSFTLIDNDDSSDAIALQNNGGFTLGGNPITPGQDFLFTSNGFSEYFSLSYTGGDGNDVVLTAVPEPATGGAALCGLVILLTGRRRRRA